MRILNHTGFRAAAIVGRMGDPAHSLTFAVNRLSSTHRRRAR
jgi:hypothetical protein